MPGIRQGGRLPKMFKPGARRWPPSLWRVTTRLRHLPSIPRPRWCRPRRALTPHRWRSWSCRAARSRPSAPGPSPKRRQGAAWSSRRQQPHLVLSRPPRDCSRLRLPGRLLPRRPSSFKRDPPRPPEGWGARRRWPSPHQLPRRSKAQWSNPRLLRPGSQVRPPVGPSLLPVELPQAPAPGLHRRRLRPTRPRARQSPQRGLRAGRVRVFLLLFRPAPPQRRIPPPGRGLACQAFVVTGCPASEFSPDSLCLAALLLWSV